MIVDEKNNDAVIIGASIISLWDKISILRQYIWEIPGCALSRYVEYNMPIYQEEHDVFKVLE